MVNFEGYYSISEEQIEFISCASTGDQEWPYKVTVTLVSGRSMSVKYKDEAGAQKAKDRLCRAVETSKRHDAEQIIGRLCQIEHGVKGLDKRQFKIWRQLGALLHIEPDEK